MRDFEEFGIKYLWCKECHKRTQHEWDPGEDEGTAHEYRTGWYCSECGGLTDQKRG